MKTKGMQMFARRSTATKRVCGGTLMWASEEWARADGAERAQVEWGNSQAVGTWLFYFFLVADVFFLCLC